MSEIIRFNQPTLFAGLTGVIDHQNCVVHGVSLITEGVTATGHDLFVDRDSVNSFHEMGTSMGQLAVNLDHGSGIISMNGFIDNFRRDNGKWRGDWHLLKTHAETPVMLERCERQSKTFGFSLAFSGDKAGVLRNGKKCAHPEALLSADCVVRPAANKSLFSARDNESVDNAKLIELKNMPQEPTPTNEPTMADVLAQLQQLSQAVQQQGEIQNQIVGHINQSTENQDLSPEEQLNQLEQLEQLHNASDEELAQHGISRAEVDAAVAEYNDSVGSQGEQDQGEQGQGESEGELATAGVEGGAPGGATMLSALHREVVQLKAEAARDKTRKRLESENIQFAAVEGKINTLAAQRDQAIELAEKVIAENEALRVHLSTGTRPVAMGVDEGVRLFSANGNGELHPYQVLLKQVMFENKCTEGAAIRFADKADNGALHAQWLQSLGARTINA